VNDRGPFAHGRIVDLSRRAARLLGFRDNGTARVRVQVLGNESRALAYRIKGQAELAAEGTPIATTTGLPKAAVSSQALPPPSQEASASGAMAPPPSTNAGADSRNKGGVPLGVVSLQPVSSTQIFIQAGAYAHYDNANRVRATLSSLGPVRVTQVMVKGRDLFRVRVGPLKGVGAADRLLERVIGTGYPDARIIID